MAKLYFSDPLLLKGNEYKITNASPKEDLM